MEADAEAEIYTEPECEAATGDTILTQGEKALAMEDGQAGCTCG